MEYLFVSYEIAKQLKEIKFNKPTAIGYDSEGTLTNMASLLHPMNYNNGIMFSAPLYQQVEEWLLDKHSIFILFEYDFICWDFKIVHYAEVVYSFNSMLSTGKNEDFIANKKEAYERSIQAAINVIKLRPEAKNDS